MRPKTSDGGEDNALEGDGEVVSVVEWKSSKIGGDARVLSSAFTGPEIPRSIGERVLESPRPSKTTIWL